MEPMTDAEIGDLARRLADLLTDPHPGLHTWHEAKVRLGRQLHTALGNALGEPMRGVQVGNGNTQTNTFGLRK